MNRRSFFIATAALLLKTGLFGCSRQSSETLNIRLLQNSIPVQVLEAFKRSQQRQSSQPIDLKFAPDVQLEKLFAYLEQWQQKPAQATPRPRLPFPWEIRSHPPTVANLVTLGDYWLATAIQRGLIQPLDLQSLPHWQKLPARWQTLVRRNLQGELDPNGSLWAAPYRWGTTLIAYRADKFNSLGWQPEDWGDLWRPELRQRISVLDQAREVIGLTLKKLGLSYNSRNLQTVAELKAQLKALQPQVKLYSSSAYLQPLLLGDTWLAVGWSADVLAAMQRHPQIQAVVPQSGTALWADLWVQPKSAPTNALVQPWIDFCWQGTVAQQISVQSRAISPVLITEGWNAVARDLEPYPFLLPKADVLDRSEFLEPLPEATLKQYQTLWERLRTATL